MCGRPAPVNYKIVPPNGLRAVFGVTLEIVRPTEILAHEESIGTMPIESITTGCQFPATGITVHLI